MLRFKVPGIVPRAYMEAAPVTFPRRVERSFVCRVRSLASRSWPVKEVSGLRSVSLSFL